MRGALIALFVLLLLSAAVATSAVLVRDYNQLAIERSDIQERWSQLEADMKRRARDIRSGPPSLLLVRDAVLNAKGKREEMEANNHLDDLVGAEMADATQKIDTDRSEYNEAIQKYNTDLKLFPKNVTASLFRFQRDDEYFR